MGKQYPETVITICSVDSVKLGDQGSKKEAEAAT